MNNHSAARFSTHDLARFSRLLGRSDYVSLLCGSSQHPDTGGNERDRLPSPASNFLFQAKGFVARGERSVRINRERTFMI